MVDLRAPQGAPEPDPHHLDLAIWRLLPALVFAVQQDETAARATWGRSCARWTPASRPRRASEATVRTRSHWAGSKSGRYEHSGSGRQNGAAGRLPKVTVGLESWSRAYLPRRMGPRWATLP